MALSTRRVLVVAALLTITGCGGTTGQSSLAPSGTISFLANRLFVPAGASFSVAHHSAVQRSIHATYSTKKSLLFASDGSNDTVNIFLTSQLANNPLPIATITEPSGGCPYGLTLDKKKTLYLVDKCLNQVEEYSKGSTTLKRTISDGISTPIGVAIDKDNTLYVSINVSTGGEIQEYAKGSTSPTKTITGMYTSIGISLDAGGNLYVADVVCACVWELPAGGSSVTNLGLQDLMEPYGSAVDQKTGYLWVTDGGTDRVQIYKLGSTSPAETITGYTQPYSVAVQNQGKPLGEAIYGDIGTDDAYVYKPNSYTPFATLTNTGLPYGLLLSKP